MNVSPIDDTILYLVHKAVFRFKEAVLKLDVHIGGPKLGALSLSSKSAKKCRGHSELSATCHVRKQDLFGIQ